MTLTAPAIVGADVPIPTKAERAAEVRLPNRDVTLPLTMVNEFPFVSGSIAGVQGKLMLDTGIGPAITVNSHRVPVIGSRDIGVGHFGSGQKFSVQLVPEIRRIAIGGLYYRLATTVEAQDAQLLEGITPDFIGWFGHYAWATDHALKLDYDRRIATFAYGPVNQVLAHERLIAALPFKTRKLPNHPIMTGKIGDLSVIAAWDTGQNGTLFTTPADKQRMLKDGRLTPSRATPDAFNLHGLRLNDEITVELDDITVSEEPSPAAAPLGIEEPTTLTIGYSLLRQYKTVFDYRSKRIYLLARNGSSKSHA